MKKLVYLSALLLVFIVQQGYGQKIRTLFYNNILHGKVKQITGIQYLSGTIGIELKDTTWYDEQGNTLENHRTTRHGTIFKEKYITSNDASGKKMEIIGSEKDQILSAKFDAKGNMIEYDSYFKKGGVNFRSFYEYDEKNNLVSFRNVDKDNNIELKRTYKYDNDENLIAEDTWGKNGKFDSHTDFQYISVDKTGNWTKRISHKTWPTGKIVNDFTIIRQITYY